MAKSSLNHHISFSLSKFSGASSPGLAVKYNHHDGLVEWTPKEQAILEEGLSKYASESDVVRYAKIALQLHCKTIRDVALRVKWMKLHGTC